MTVLLWIIAILSYLLGFATVVASSTAAIRYGSSAPYFIVATVALAGAGIVGAINSMRDRLSEKPKVSATDEVQA
jgi:hypothetical protein